jgi:hypothetical protein
LRHDHIRDQGGVEDDARVRDGLDISQLMHKLIAIHRWHENFGNDQVWLFSACEGEGLSAFDGLKEAMAGVTEEGYLDSSSEIS